MNTTLNQCKHCFLHHLLSLSVLAMILISLTMPGIAYAADPEWAPYIIVFKDSGDPIVEAQGLANAYGLQPGFVYQHALKGMSALVPAGRLNALQHDPRVAYVVEDMLRSIDAQSMPTGIQRIFADTNQEITTASKSPCLDSVFFRSPIQPNAKEASSTRFK